MDLYVKSMMDVKVEASVFDRATKSSRKKVPLEDVLVRKCAVHAANQWNKTNGSVRLIVNRYMSSGGANQLIRECTGAGVGSPPWTAAMSSCMKANDKAPQNLLALPQKDFIRGHVGNGLPHYIGAILVFIGGVDDLSFSEANRLHALDSNMATPKRFVDPGVCSERTDPDHAQYAPYGRLFIALVADTMAAWPVIRDILPSDDILVQGPKFVQQWCDDMFEENYRELYDEEAKSSWYLDFNTHKWDAASPEERGDPVCGIADRVCASCIIVCRHDF